MVCRPTSKFNRTSQVLVASAHASRIRKFILEDCGAYDTNHLARIFSKPAPNLTHLELWTPRLGEITPFPNLFGLELPKLRKLELGGVGAWPKIVGANLAWIRIDESLDPHILSRCIPYSPNLKVLKLMDIWDISELDVSTWQRIALPPGVRLTIKYSPMCPLVLALFSLPQDCHLKVGHSVYITPGTSLLSRVLPDDIAPFQNLRTLTRLHITARFNLEIGLELKCFRSNWPALDVNIRFFPDMPTVAEENGTPAMRLLGNLRRIVLKGMEELRMEGFVGRLKPQAVELFAFLKRMPALTRLITTDDNEEVLRYVLDIIGRRAVVVKVER